MTLAPDRMIPLLPCRSIDDQLAFYAALGFEVTYQQKSPNVYAAVQRGAIEMHFFVMKDYDPSASYSTCYVMVSEVDPLYADFRAGLKAGLGRVPTRGLPRLGAIGDMSYGVRQFLLTDPGGNIIRFGQPLATLPAPDTAPRAAPGSRLEKALAAATLLMHSKVDPEMAARVVDAALADVPEAAGALLLRALVLRAEAAHALGDDVLATEHLTRAATVTLAADDRREITDELNRADELRLALA
jgi:hypothetical protein